MIRPYDFAEVRKRVREQLAAIGHPPASSLAERYGLGKDYIRDIIAERPRKKKIGADKLNLLAAALECDADYLTLAQNEPRRRSELAPVGKEQVGAKPLAVFIGFLDAAAWRSPGRATPIPTRFKEAIARQELGVPQLIAIMRGTDMEGARILDDMLIAAWPYEGEHIIEGSVVIVQWTRDDLVKLSACEVHYDGTKTILRLHPKDGPPEVIREAKADAMILGVVNLAIHVAEPHGRDCRFPAAQ